MLPNSYNTGAVLCPSGKVFLNTGYSISPSVVAGLTITQAESLGGGVSFQVTGVNTGGSTRTVNLRGYCGTVTP